MPINDRKLQTVLHFITHNIHLVHNSFNRKVHGKRLVSGSGKVEKYRIGVAVVKNYFTVTHFIIHVDVSLAQENCQMWKSDLKSKDKI